MTEELGKIFDLTRLGGDFRHVRMAIGSGENTAVFSVTAVERAVIFNGLKKQIVYVVKDRQSADKALNIIRSFTDKAAALYEREEPLVYRGAAHESTAKNRVKTLIKLNNGEINILIITAAAMAELYPDPKSLSARTLSVGEEYRYDELISLLIGMGLKRVESVENRREFSFNGDILSVFPDNYNNPLRLSFFDETLEYIHEYDRDSLKTLGESDILELYPACEFTISDSVILRAENEIKKLPADARVRAREILEEIALHRSADVSARHAQWLYPLADGNTDIFEYMQDDAVIAIDDGMVFLDRMKLSYNEFVERYLGLIQDGEVLPSHVKAMLNSAELKERINKHVLIVFAALTGSTKDIICRKYVNFNSAPPVNYYMNYNSFYKDVSGYLDRGMQTVICCGDEYTAESIKKSLFENGIFSEYLSDSEERKSGVLITDFYLPLGFVSEKSKIAVIGRDQLIRKKEIKSARKKKLSIMPKCGDYVVHEFHGIGLCAGTEKITDRGITKDYVVLLYHGNNKLYVPVDQTDRLERYSGSDIAPKLSKIGGKDWEKITERVKKAVREMAFSLVELYRKRQECNGFKYSPDTGLQREFEEAFEWDETEDQLRAAEEIKSDMERGLVMDRLLCGDVGYGKTEVALRAVFKTVSDNKQAAILAPTTILARQHYITAVRRFEGFGIETVLLTRLQSKEELDDAMKRIKSGKVNVVIGTHKILSENVKFRDLGLLVLDEEQRFGVEHKEKLKVSVNNVNVLTLSATPIPRTLSMALTGIRDISVLETPPRERRPIATYVTEMSDSLLKDAISRELNRGGQVFVLYNRVETIDSIAEKIRSLVSGAQVVVGHGRMQPSELESVINKFYIGEANVFVATTIIENGVDLPNANTIIVFDSDRLGLSAMYQLRGRVGRSDRQAYAYFTTRKGKALTEEAEKRLLAITEYTEFGSGYRIAMRDLEIRGAGNVLGREQSGHIVKVGYDMYCKLLEEAVNEISGGEIKAESDTEMYVDIDAYLDENYIGSIDEKIKIFKEIAAVSTKEERGELLKRMTLSYGEPGPGLLNLIDIALIKNAASSIGASKVVVNASGAHIEFKENVFKNRSAIELISANSDICSMNIEGMPRLTFKTNGMSIGKKLELIEKFLLK